MGGNDGYSQSKVTVTAPDQLMKTSHWTTGPWMFRTYQWMYIWEMESSCSGFGTPNPTNLGVWVMRWLLCVWATLCSNQPKMLAQPWGWSLLDRHYQWCPSTMSTSASQNRFHKTIVYTGWWFQTWLLFSISYGMSSFPLTFIFFKMVIAPPTSIELATRQ